MKKEKNSHREKYHDRKDLAGEHRISDIGQIILFIIFLTIWIIDSFFIHDSTFLVNSVPLYIRIPIGLVILVYAGYLAQKGLHVVFGEVHEKPQVIRTGVFNIVRHPIYLGAILLYLGLIALTLSLYSAGFWILIIIFYHYIARHEEKLLTVKFGSDYESYMKDVPMWIPRIQSIVHL